MRCLEKKLVKMPVVARGAAWKENMLIHIGSLRAVVERKPCFMQLTKLKNVHTSYITSKQQETNKVCIFTTGSGSG